MKKTLVLISIILLFMPFISAEIFLSQPKPTYNLGDILNITVRITGPAEGLIETSLVCNEKQAFYVEYLSIKEAEEKIVEKELKLTKDSGTCYVISTLNQETKRTSNFQITDNLKLEVSLNKEYFLPSETLEISGTIQKSEGKKVNGRVEFYIGNDFLKEGIIKNNLFSENITFPTNLILKEYPLKIIAFDENNLNKGELIKTIALLSVPDTIEINLINNSEESLKIIPIIYDQRKDKLQGNISLLVYSPSNQLIYSKEISSGEVSDFNLPKNAEIGNWKIQAFSQSISSEKHFYINPKEEISVSLDGDILVVENTGNVPYKKLTKIDLSSDTETFNENIMIDIAIGEIQRLKLSAPDGEYKVAVAGKSFSNVMLTGASISIEKLSQGIFTRNPVISSIILFAIVIILFFFIQGRGIKKEISKAGKIFSREVENRKYIEVKLGKTEEEKKKIKELFDRYLDKNLVEKAISGKLKQGKHEASFLFTDLRGYTKLSSEPEKVKPLLDKYFEIITSAVHLYGGAISQIIGDAAEAMFNVTVEQEDHVLKAVKAGMKIKKELERYNRTKSPKEPELKSGIGIDFGDIFLGNIGKEVTRYQPIGDAINIAYNLSKENSNQVFISKKVYEKLKNRLKVKRIGPMKIKQHTIEVYEVLEII